MKCYRCGTTDEESKILRCSICGREFCPGCAYLMRGDEFCSKACAYKRKFPDEGKIYMGGQGD